MGMQYSLLLLLLCQAFLILTSAADFTVLKPFDYITGELVELDTGVKRYLLADLKPSTGYEVRVSFPASIPAAIKYRIIDSSAKAGTQFPSTTQPARRLLDCEKLIFSTDSTGAVQGFTQPAVLLTANRRSIHRDGPTAGPSQLVYNIVLAELLPYLGLPFDSVPTVAAVAGVALLALVWSLYWSTHLHPQLLNWLAEPQAATNSNSTATTTTAAAQTKQRTS